MRIALVTSDYPPLRSSCAIQMRNLAQEFLLQGHEPIVIVPAEGFNKGSKSEVLDGVKVFRIASFRIKNINYFRRALGEILMPFTILYGLHKNKFHFSKLDAVVWYSPSIFFGPLISVFKKISKCRTYLILRDIFPEWALDLGLIKKGPVYYLFKLIANYQYSVADTIGVQTPSNLDYMSAWAESSKKRLEVLQNWLSPTDEVGSSISVANTHLAGRKIFVYIGNMGIAQGMDILIGLAQQFKYRHDIGFLFVGRGTEVARLRTQSMKYNLDNILFYNEIDPREIPSLLAMCHIGLIALDPRHKSHNIPGKFLTYLQVGLPVLARINSCTDLGKLIEEEGVGRVYVGSDLDEFKSIAEDLINGESELQKMSKRGRALSERMFSSSAVVKQIVSALLNRV